MYVTLLKRFWDAISENNDCVGLMTHNSNIIKQIIIFQRFLKAGLGACPATAATVADGGKCP
jgi:hypothetical protein